MASNTRFMNPPTIAKPGGYSPRGRNHRARADRLYRWTTGSEAQWQTSPVTSAAQVVQAFENLKSAFAAVGASASTDVVKLNNYLVDIKTNLPLYREVPGKYVNTAQPPASTTVGVTALARPDALFEAEAIVMLAK